MGQLFTNNSYVVALANSGSVDRIVDAPVVDNARFMKGRDQVAALSRAAKC